MNTLNELNTSNKKIIDEIENDKQNVENIIKQSRKNKEERFPKKNNYFLEQFSDSGKKKTPKEKEVNFWNEEEKEKDKKNSLEEDCKNEDESFYIF